MTEYVHLIGAEQVEKAGYAMRDAAADMQRSVSSLDGILEQHRRFMEDWLQRFEGMLTAMKEKP